MRAFSWRIRSRICACTVTSSAVVGSSAISSFGEQASAMAIITRWRMPPDSSCGYCFTRRSGSGNADDHEAVDGALHGGLLSRVPGAGSSVSPICRPMVRTGLSDVIGSWKIIEMSLPRILRISASVFSKQVRRPGNGRHLHCGPGGSGISRKIGHGSHRLAAARLADDRQNLAFLDVERQPVDRAHDAGRQCESAFSGCRLRAAPFAFSVLFAPCADRARRADRRRAG